MSRQCAHLKKRREQGLCGREGCPNMSGEKYRCDKHAKEHADERKAAYWAKREKTERERAA